MEERSLYLYATGYKREQTEATSSGRAGRGLRGCHSCTVTVVLEWLLPQCPNHSVSVVPPASPQQERSKGIRGGWEWLRAGEYVVWAGELTQPSAVGTNPCHVSTVTCPSQGAFAWGSARAQHPGALPPCPSWVTYNLLPPKHTGESSATWQPSTCLCLQL